MKYKTKRPVGGKPPIWVIVDENENIVNRNPNKDELKSLNAFPKEYYKTNRRSYKEEELLNELRRFEKGHGRPPTVEDFSNNPEYPDSKTYQKRFGSWNKALRQVGFDVESIVKKGILVTCQQKARLAEIIVRNHFKTHPVDLAGENCKSPCDGICPNGKIYDVKTSKLYRCTYWDFHTDNKYKEEIEIYYFLAFNEDYTELEYVWRVPGEIVEKDRFCVGMKRSEKTIDNMEEYDITDKFRDIFKDIFEISQCRDK